MDDFRAGFAPNDYSRIPQPNFFQPLSGLENFQAEIFSLPMTLPVPLPKVTPSVETVTCDTTSSPADSFYDAVASGFQTRKRQRQTSSPCEPESLIRFRKTRKLRAPEETAKVREKGACYLCQLKRKECQHGDDPEGSCLRCLERAKTITVIPGLLSPVCWRPNIGYTEVFRRGPTVDFAHSLRGNSKDEEPGKQALWKHFTTKRSSQEVSKTIQLSQSWTANTLNIPLDRYKPKEGDKQYYTWFDNGHEQQYHTPPYGISNLYMVRSALEKFVGENSAGYIEAHMVGANEITQKTFQVAQEHKHHLPLIERALKLWVCCRFIEEPWSIVGEETLGMTPEENLNCPYSDRIPVPPIVDLQIDLVVINELLKPELKSILKMLKTMLESNKAWTNWFEMYLAYFILLNNVELTMAHDLWFATRNNLKTKYSNKALIDAVTQGATTLLTCFHYAHQGYAPFSNIDLENTEGWTDAEKGYLHIIRPLVNQLQGDHVNDPAKELFWTSQLHKPDWRPVVLMC